MSAVVKMLKTAAGPEGSWIAGQNYDVPAEMPEGWARNFVGRGAAEWVTEPASAKLAPAAETATLEPGEGAGVAETAEITPRKRGRPRKRA